MNDKIETNDDDLNDFSNDQSGKADEIINISNEQNSLTQTQNSENMEVHHHSSHHGEKTWRTYGWEFGMLFLAVFCGFLAEYFLEHRIEKEKGKQYILSMIEDLKSDSVKISDCIVGLKMQKTGLDSLSQLCSNPPYDDITVKRMYQLMGRNTGNVFILRFTKRTITQLRNSGGMRLIKNKESADAITEYSELTEGIESQGQYYADHGVNEMVNLNRKIFNIKHFRGYSNKEQFFSKSNIIKLVNDDEKLMAEYSYLTYFTSGVVEYYIQRMSALQEQIPKTIATLKKENHIK